MVHPFLILWPGEVLRLKWSDLRVNGDVTYNLTFKTEAPRVIVLDSETAAQLELYRRESGANYTDETPIFPDRSGLPYESLEVLKKLFNRLKAATGLKLKPSLVRNTAITHAIEGGVPQSIVCLKAWGVTASPMINTYSDPNSANMQRAQLGSGNGHKVEETVSQSPRCPACGAINPLTSQWCGQCGEPLTPAARARQETFA